MVFLETQKNRLRDNLQGEGLLNTPRSIGPDPIPLSSPASAIPSTTTPADAAPVPSTPGGNIGGFTGISNYLRLNRPGVKRIAGQIGQSIRGLGESAQSAITAAGEQFGSAVGEGEITSDPNLLNLLGASPQDITGSPDLSEQFQQQLGASYTGPGQIEETEFYTPALSAVREAQEGGELSQTPAGIGQLLASTSTPGARPRSSGANLLDQALLRVSPSARATLGSARESLASLDTGLTSLSEASIARALLGQETSEATSEATRQALTGAQSDFETELAELVAAAIAAATQRNLETSSLGELEYSNRPEVMEAFGLTGPATLMGPELEDLNAFLLGPSSRTEFGAYYPQFTEGLPEQVISDLGLTNEQWTDLISRIGSLETMGVISPTGFSQDVTENFGVPSADDLAAWLSREAQFDPEMFNQFVSFTEPEAQIYRENVATPEQYAQYAALQELAGLQGTFLDPTQIGLAGTAPEETADFNLNDFLTYLTGLENAATETPGTWDENVFDWLYDAPSYDIPSRYDLPVVSKFV